MLTLAEDWVWDLWLADDGATYHVFFLAAPRALRDSDLRHANARVGHAISSDLRSWTRLPDALTAGPPGAFDDVATWTGSVVREADGRWRMFYTGVSAGRQGLVQRIGSAMSEDLVVWRKHPNNPLVVADRRWYELDGDDGAAGEEWRDPWVLPDPGGDGWHMLITARSAFGGADDRGVLGHAVSDDLVHWLVTSPLTEPAGFGHLEVCQVEEVDSRPLLVFSCLRDRFSAARLGAGPGGGGVWAAPGESLLGPFDVARAAPLTDDSVYSGRLIRDRAGQWVLLGFMNVNASGRFVGALSDPMPAGWTPDGRFALLDSAIRP